MIIILGAGLSGLTAGYHLEKTKKKYLILEKEKFPGGLCTSQTVKGYTFDYTGHLLHLKHHSSKKIIRKLLKNNLKSNTRRSAIYFQNKLIPYPFQAGLYYLPENVAKECLIGFIESYYNKNKRPIKNFYEWSLKYFGTGIYKHFLKPYNEKLWKYDLKKLDIEWIKGFIPKLDLKDIVDAALSPQKKTFGYNYKFYYPKKNGMKSLIDRLIEQNLNIEYEQPPCSINLKNKTLKIKNKKLKYNYLINTIPLPEFIDIVEDLPEQLKKIKSKLKYNSVYNLNLGVKQISKFNKFNKKHWIYFPEKSMEFYRVGFYNNFSDEIVPFKNSYSLYAEVAYNNSTKPSLKKVKNKIIQDLIKYKIVNEKDEIEVECPLDIKYAYVVFNKDRKKNLIKLNEYFNKYNVINHGRYAEWTYSTMEDSIVQSEKIIKKINL